MVVKANTNCVWAIVIGGCAVFAYISYFRKGVSASDLFSSVILLFIYFTFAYIIVSVLNRLVKLFFKDERASASGIPEERQSLFDQRKNVSRDCLQAKTDNQVEVYKERILKPREESRQQKIEERLKNVIGPEFKGHGDMLGGETLADSEDSNRNANDTSRDNRKLPDSVRMHIPASEGKPCQRKRMIELPPEPEENEDGVVMVTIHTVLDQRHTRRFTMVTTLRVVFDYMITLGFSDRVYTLVLAYPRQPLTDEQDKTLEELGFGKRTLLYVEEKNL